MIKIRMIDLFSGIGGFSLAARAVWGDALENLFFCDNNKFCQAVLRKNFGKDIKIIDDIKKLTSGEPWEKEVQVDLLTAGVPCQPASCAGKRKGKEDDRWLWGETFEVIRRFKPTWCIIENVRGLVTLEQGVVFDSLLTELEGMGYEVQTLCIPACAVNAPHRRDRIWIVANSRGIDKPISIQQRRQNAAKNTDANWEDCHAADAEGKRLEGGNTAGNGCAGGRNTEYTWDTPWLTVATLTCVRGVYDGLPARVHGLELSKSKHREERLKALGNAIVPHVAIEIMRAIKEIK